MSEHPNATVLDAFAVGARDDAATRGHVDDCPECSAYVAELRAGAERFARENAPRADMFVAAVRRRAAPRRASTWVRGWAGGAASVLALAAGLALLVRSRPADHLAPIGESQPTRFKGGLQVAVIVEHLGAQSRQTEALALEPGDRIRVEIALDHDERITAGVLTDDGEWAALEPSLVLEAGTHYSEQSITFTDRVPSGHVVVGDADAVTKAQTSRDLAGVTTIRLGPR